MKFKEGNEVYSVENFYATLAFDFVKFTLKVSICLIANCLKGHSGKFCEMLLADTNFPNLNDIFGKISVRGNVFEWNG